MNDNFKPDFGIYIKENLSTEFYMFYDVKIFDLAIVDHNLFSFGSVCHAFDKQFFATFDFNGDKMEELIQHINDVELLNNLQLFFDKSEIPRSIKFENNPITVGIDARLGELVDSKYEKFIPFIVNKFF